MRHNSTAPQQWTVGYPAHTHPSHTHPLHTQPHPTSPSSPPHSLVLHTPYISLNCQEEIPIHPTLHNPPGFTHHLHSPPGNQILHTQHHARRRQALTFPTTQDSSHHNVPSRGRPSHHPHSHALNPHHSHHIPHIPQKISHTHPHHMSDPHRRRHPGIQDAHLPHHPIPRYDTTQTHHPSHRS